MPIPFSKPALTYTQQVDLLRRRGMSIPDMERAVFYLGGLNYYRLAAYWLPFEQDHPSHTFRPGTTFDDVLRLYVFDRELRLLMMDFIERFEIAVRARWAYELAHAHGSHAHLEADLHGDQQHYDRNLQDLKEAIGRAVSQEEFVRHLVYTYLEETPPIWAVCEVMPIGLLSRWYTNLSDFQVKDRIARPFGIPHQLLSSWLHHVATVRNACAHHGRLWNREFTVIPRQPRSIPPDVARSWNPGSRRIYNTLLIALHAMDVISPNHSWRTRLRQLMSHMPIQEGWLAMGAPSGWRPEAL